MEFSQIAILLVVAAGFGIVARLLKQPLLVGYLFAGIIMGVLGFVHETAALQSFAQIGVALLLFQLGLEMNIGELPTIGKVALTTGIGQIVATSLIGFLLASVLGFSLLSSVYIAVALTFSSTIIMVKLLSEKNDLGSLYGKISVGFLLVQDFVAVLILMFLASLGTSGFGTSQYLVTLAKATGLFAVIWLLSKKALPRFFDKILASSTELLFIASIAWALGVAGFVAGPLGFSLEIGGFLAGIALSGLPEHLQIGSRTRPLRDFFLTMFFLLLGAQLVVGGNISKIIIPSIIFSVFVLVGNPVIVLVIMGFLGYKKRTSFLAGLTVAQISEFSLILMSMGLALGHLTQSDVSTVVLVGVITMTVSTYLILGADSVYARIKHLLNIFERSTTKEATMLPKQAYERHIVLVGCDRTGRNLVKYFNKKGWPFLIVDFNPKVFNRLTAENTPVIFGDINDPDILEVASLDKAQIVISTTSNLADNLSLLEHLKTIRTKAALIFTSQTKSDALKLYEKGASYVIVPDVVAGDHIRHLLRVYGLKGKRLKKAGRSHFDRLIFT